MHTLSDPVDRAQLIARLRTVRADDRPQWGRLSAPEMVRHCIDLYKGMIGDIPLSGVRVGPLVRALTKWVALETSLGWPKRIPTRPEVDPQRGGSRPRDFATDVIELEQICDRFGQNTAATGWGVHPLFGKMSDPEWHRWGYRHLDHHLRQFKA